MKKLVILGIILILCSSYTYMDTIKFRNILRGHVSIYGNVFIEQEELKTGDTLTIDMGNNVVFKIFEGGAKIIR